MMDLHRETDTLSPPDTSRYYSRGVILFFDKFFKRIVVVSGMNSEDPLSDWHFLIGKWKGGSTNEFGGEGEIVSTAIFSKELGRFIMGKIDSFRNGKLENANVSFMFYDARDMKFRRKTFFSYGFVNNEVEYERSENEIRFAVVSEPSPQAFEGMRWQSYLRKISDTEIHLGLESAKEGEDFQSYGTSVLTKST